MAREVIINLYNMGYRIILFSNNCCFVDSCVDEEINKYIEHIYYSYDMGYTKSDKEAYQIIINDLKVMPNEILHIGDSYMNDYLILRENGFEVLFYGNNKNVVNKIDNLSDIYDFLKKEKTFLKEA